MFHTVLVEDPATAALMARSMAAGYYEYSPALFEVAGLSWDGPPIEELRRRVRPDFHHAPDLERSGALVDFLPDAAADAFCLRGSVLDVADQLVRVLALGREMGAPFEIVVPHPVPNPPAPDQTDGPTYMERMARDVIPAVRVALDA